ncbi:MAG: 8-oxo-dGTP diphosphatase MutT [Candidatus Omnitrophica bacterium]|nr:8-oxo-dGTP diphosphatase MutT [Candidatus Omnitrophota bacterium]
MTSKTPTFEVVCAVIFRRNRILITQRPAGSYYGGFWEFPGGKRERGESLEAALARELTEEIGILVSKPQFWRKVNYKYPDRNVTLHFFLCAIRGGVPRPIGCSAIRWIRHSDLESYSFPPADVSVINELVNSSSFKLEIPDALFR